MTAIATVTERLQGRLEVEGTSPNRRKSQVLPPNGVRPEHLTEEQRREMESLGLALVRQGMVII